MKLEVDNLSRMVALIHLVCPFFLLLDCGLTSLSHIKLGYIVVYVTKKEMVSTRIRNGIEAEREPHELDEEDSDK